LSSPRRFTAALWELIQSVQLLVMETAGAMISLARLSSLPGFITVFSFCQVASRWSGLLDRACQKFGMKLILSS
jgi:hypothetical protein